MLNGIHWLGHASFRIELGGMVIYIDPWNLKHPVPADLVLVTHDHHDHLSPADIRAITKPDTAILYAGKGSPELKGHLQAVEPGEKLIVGAAVVESVPAYNLHKAFHPRASNYVGYVLTLAGVSIYHAGDTDLIPEMASIRCDAALLPIGGKYTMDAAEAARALGVIKPKYGIPMHYGAIVGNPKDARRFQELAPKTVEVVLLQQE